MRRAFGVVIGLALGLSGVLLALYGLFALLYGGDSGGGDTYVTFFDHEIDAGLAGAVALLIAFLLIVLAATIFPGRKRKRFAKSS